MDCTYHPWTAQRTASSSPMSEATGRLDLLRVWLLGAASAFQLRTTVALSASLWKLQVTSAPSVSTSSRFDQRHVFSVLGMHIQLVCACKTRQGSSLRSCLITVLCLSQLPSHSLAAVNVQMYICFVNESRNFIKSLDESISRGYEKSCDGLQPLRLQSQTA